MLIGTTILVLDSMGVAFGLMYGLVLTAVSALALLVFMWVVDRDRVMAGSSYTSARQRRSLGVTVEQRRLEDVRAPEEAAWR
jgi:hypothetical protein